MIRVSKQIVGLVIGGIVNAVALGEEQPVVNVFYDSTKHSVISIPTIFSVEKIDVSESRKIEASITERLQLERQGESIEAVQNWAVKKVAQDREIQRLMSELPNTYRWLEKAHTFGISKVPAVVISYGEDDFVVYGQTDIRKAINLVSAYRVGDRR